MDLKGLIRDVADFPIKGVGFKDITTLLQNKKAFAYAIDKLAKPYLDKKIDKVIAIDARGFLLAAPLAYKLKAGVCLVRKKGKLPYKTIQASFKKEYGMDILTMHKDAVGKEEKVLIADDVLATGGTIMATVKLVEKLGGKIVGISVLIDLPFLGGSKKLEKYKLKSLVVYEK